MAVVDFSKWDFERSRELGYENALLGKPITQTTPAAQQGSVYNKSEFAKKTRAQNYAGMSRNEELFRNIGIVQRDKEDYTSYTKWFLNNGGKHKAGFEEEGKEQLMKEQALVAFENRDPDTTYEQWAWDNYGMALLEENGYYVNNPNWWASRIAKGDKSNPLEDEEFVKTMQQKVLARVELLGLNKLKDMKSQWELLVEEDMDTDVVTAQGIEEARKIYDARLNEFTDELEHKSKILSLFKAGMLDEMDPIIYDEEGKPAFYLTVANEIVTLTDDKELAKRKGYGYRNYELDGKTLESIQLGNGNSLGTSLGEGLLKGAGKGAINLVAGIGHVAVTPLTTPQFISNFISRKLTGKELMPVNPDLPFTNLNGVIKEWSEGLITDAGLRNDDEFTLDGHKTPEMVQSDVAGVAGEFATNLIVSALGAAAAGTATKAAQGAEIAGNMARATALRNTAAVFNGINRLTGFSNGNLNTGLTMIQNSALSSLVLAARSAGENYGYLKLRQPLTGWTDEEIETNVAMNFAVNATVSFIFREVGSEANNFYTRWAPVLTRVAPKATANFNQMMQKGAFGRMLTSATMKYTVIGGAADMFENITTMASDSMYSRVKASDTKYMGLDVLGNEMRMLSQDPTALAAVLIGGGLQLYQGRDFGMSDVIQRFSTIGDNVLHEMDVRIEKKRQEPETPKRLQELNEMLAVKDALLKKMVPTEGKTAPEAMLDALNEFAAAMGGKKTFIDDVVEREVKRAAKIRIQERMDMTRDMYYSTYIKQGDITREAFNNPDKFTKDVLNNAGKVLGQFKKNKTQLTALHKYITDTATISRYKDQLNLLEEAEKLQNNGATGMQESEYFKVFNVAELQKTDPEEYARIVKDHGLTKEDEESFRGGTYLIVSKTAGTKGEVDEVERIRKEALSFLAAAEEEYINKLKLEFPDEVFEPLIQRLGKDNGNDALFIINKNLDVQKLMTTANHLSAFINANYELVHGTHHKLALDRMAKVLDMPEGPESRGALIYDMWKRGSLSTRDAIAIINGLADSKESLKIPNELDKVVNFVRQYREIVQKPTQKKVSDLVSIYNADPILQEMLQKAKLITPEDMKVLGDEKTFRSPEKAIPSLAKRLLSVKTNSEDESGSSFLRAANTVLKQVTGQNSHYVMLEEVDQEGAEATLKKYNLLTQAGDMSSLDDKQKAAHAKKVIESNMTPEQILFKAVIERQKALKESGLDTEVGEGNKFVVYINLNELATKFLTELRAKAATDETLAAKISDNGELRIEELVNVLNLANFSPWQQKFYRQLLAANAENGVLEFNLADAEQRALLDDTLKKLGHELTSYRIENGELIEGVYYRPENTNFVTFEIKDKAVFDTKVEQVEMQKSLPKGSHGAALEDEFVDTVYVDDDTEIEVLHIQRSAVMISPEAKPKMGFGALLTMFADKAGKLSRELCESLTQVFNSNAVEGKVDIQLRNYLALEQMIDTFEKKFADGYPYELGDTGGRYFLEFWGSKHAPRFNAEAVRARLAKDNSGRVQAEILRSLLCANPDEIVKVYTNMYATNTTIKSGETSSQLASPYEVAISMNLEFDPGNEFTRSLPKYLKEKNFTYGHFTNKPLDLRYKNENGKMVKAKTYAEIMRVLDKPINKRNVNAIMLRNQLLAMKILSTNDPVLKRLLPLFEVETLKQIGHMMDAGKSDEEIAAFVRSLHVEEQSGPDEVGHKNKYVQGQSDRPNEDARLAAVNLKRSLKAKNKIPLDITAEDIAVLREFTRKSVDLYSENIAMSFVRENAEASVATRMRVNGSTDTHLRLSTMDLMTMSAEELEVFKRFLSKEDATKLDELVQKFQDSIYQYTDIETGQRVEGDNKSVAAESSKVGFDGGTKSQAYHEARGFIQRRLKKHTERNRRYKVSNFHNYVEFTGPFFDKYYGFIDKAVGGKSIHSGSIYLDNMDNTNAVVSMVEDVEHIILQLDSLGLTPEVSEKLALEIYSKTAGMEEQIEPIRYTVIGKDGEIIFQAAHNLNQYSDAYDELYLKLITTKFGPESTLLIHKANSNQLEAIPLSPDKIVTLRNAMMAEMFRMFQYDKPEEFRILVDDIRNGRKNGSGYASLDQYVMHRLEAHVSQGAFIDWMLDGDMRTMLEQTGTTFTDLEWKKISRILRTNFDDVQSGDQTTIGMEALRGAWVRRFGSEPSFYDETIRNRKIQRIKDLIDFGISRFSLSKKQEHFLSRWSNEPMFLGLNKYLLEGILGKTNRIKDEAIELEMAKIVPSDLKLKASDFRHYVRNNVKALTTLERVSSDVAKNTPEYYYLKTYEALLAADKRNTAFDKHIAVELKNYLEDYQSKVKSDKEFKPEVPKEAIASFFKKVLGRSEDAEAMRFIFAEGDDTTAAKHYLDHLGVKYTNNLIQGLVLLRTQVRDQGMMHEVPRFTPQQRKNIAQMLNQIEEVSQQRLLNKAMSQDLYEAKSKHKSIIKAKQTNALDNILNVASLVLEADDDAITLDHIREEGRSSKAPAPKEMPSAALFKYGQARKTLVLNRKPSTLNKITGGRISQILGFNPFNTPFKAWLDIFGIKSEAKEITDAKDTGMLIEPKQQAYSRTKLKGVTTPDEFYTEEQLRNEYREDFFPTEEIFGGKWDAITVEDGKITGVVEYKTYNIEDEFKDGVPNFYAAQALMYAKLLGVKKVYVVATYVPKEIQALKGEGFEPDDTNTRIIELDVDDYKMDTPNGKRTISELMDDAAAWRAKYIEPDKPESPEFDTTDVASKRQVDYLAKAKMIASDVVKKVEATKQEVDTTKSRNELDRTVATRRIYDLSIKWIRDLAKTGPTNNMSKNDLMVIGMERFKEVLDVLFSGRELETSDEVVKQVAEEIRVLLTDKRAAKGLAQIVDWKDFLSNTTLEKKVSAAGTYQLKRSDLIKQAVDRALHEDTELKEFFDYAEIGDNAFWVSKNLDSLIKTVTSNTGLPPEYMAELFNEGLTFYNENLDKGVGFTPDSPLVNMTTSSFEENMKKVKALELGTSLTFKRLWNLVSEKLPGDLIRGADGKTYTMDSNTLAIPKSHFEALFGMSYDSFQRLNPKAYGVFYAAVIRSPIDKADGAHPYRIIVTNEKRGGILMTRDSLLSRHSGDLDGDHIAIFKPIMEEGEQRYYRDIAKMNARTYGVLDDLYKKLQAVPLKDKYASKVIAMLYSDASEAAVKFFNEIDNDFEKLSKGELDYERAVEEYKIRLLTFLQGRGLPESFVNALFDSPEELERLVKQTYLIRNEADMTVDGKAAFYTTNNRNVYFKKDTYINNAKLLTLLESSHRFRLLNSDKETGHLQKNVNWKDFEAMEESGEKIASIFGFVPIRLTEETKRMVNLLSAEDMLESLNKLDGRALELYNEYRKAGVDQGDAFELALQKNEMLVRQETLTAEFFETHQSRGAFQDNLDTFHKATAWANEIMGPKNPWYAGSTRDMSMFLREVLYSAVEQFGGKDTKVKRDYVDLEKYNRSGRSVKAKIAFVSNKMNADHIYVSEQWAKAHPLFQITGIPEKQLGAVTANDKLKHDVHYEGRTFPAGSKVIAKENGMAFIQVKVPLSSSTKVAIPGTSWAKGTIEIVKRSDKQYHEKIPLGYDVATNIEQLVGSKSSVSYVGDDMGLKNPDHQNDYSGFDGYLTVVEDTSLQRQNVAERPMDTLMFANSFNGLVPLGVAGGKYLSVKDGVVTLDPSITVDALNSIIEKPDLLQNNGMSWLRTMQGVILVNRLMPNGPAKTEMLKKIVDATETANSQIWTHYNALLKEHNLDTLTFGELQEVLMKTYGATPEEAAFFDTSVMRLGIPVKEIDFAEVDPSSLKYVSKSDPYAQMRQTERTVTGAQHQSTTMTFEESANSRMMGKDSRMQSKADTFASMSDVQLAVYAAIAKLKGDEFDNSYSLRYDAIKEATRRGGLNVGRGYGGALGAGFNPQSVSDSVERPFNYTTGTIKKDQKAAWAVLADDEMRYPVSKAAPSLDFDSVPRKFSETLSYDVGKSGKYNYAKFDLADGVRNATYRDMFVIGRNKTVLDMLQDREHISSAYVRPSRAKFIVSDDPKVRTTYEYEIDKDPIVSDSVSEAKALMSDSFTSIPQALASNKELLQMNAVVDSLIPQGAFADNTMGAELTRLLTEFDDRKVHTIEDEEQFKAYIMEYLDKELIPSKVEMGFSETLKAYQGDARLQEQLMFRKAAEEAAREPLDIPALKEDASLLLHGEPNTGKNVTTPENFRYNKWGLSRAGVVAKNKGARKAAFGVDFLLNRVKRQARFETQSLLGESFNLLVGRLAQLPLSVRKDFNRWVQTSVVLKFQRPENYEAMLKKLGYENEADARNFTSTFELTYPELVGLHGRIVKEREMDFAEFNKKEPNEATILALYAPYARKAPDIFHLKRRQEGLRGGRTDEINVNQFTPENIEEFGSYDFLRNMISLTEHIANKRAMRTLGRSLTADGYIDTATVGQTVRLHFLDAFKTLDGKFFWDKAGARYENLSAIADLAESKGIYLSRYLDREDANGTLTNMMSELDRQIDEFPERLSFYELNKRRGQFTPEEALLADLYQIQSELANFAMHNIPSLRQDLQKEIEALEHSGLVLVDGFGRRISKINQLRHAPDSSIDAEHIVRKAFIALDPLSAMLLGDVGLMDARLAQHLEDTVYLVKEQSIVGQLMTRIMQNAVRTIMSLPNKVLPRIVTYTYSDIGLMAMSDARSVAGLPEARREWSAFLQSNGAVESPEFRLFMMTQGLAPATDKGMGYDPIKMDEKRVRRSAGFSKYYDQVLKLFEMQTGVTRYALWKQMYKNLQDNNPNLGNAYHRKAELEYFDEKYDKDVANAYKAAYIVDNTMGSPGGFPIGATAGGRYFTFISYSYALVRGTTESARSMGVAGVHALSDKSAFKSFVIPGAGNLAAGLIGNALIQYLADNLGTQETQEDDDENDGYIPPQYYNEAVRNGTAPDILSSLWNRELVLASGTYLSPFMAMYQMFVAPWLQTYPDGTPVPMDEKIVDAFDQTLGSKMHPIAKLVYETLMQKDSTGFGMVDKDPTLSDQENILRKLFAYGIGNKAATTMFNKAHNYRTGDKDMSFVESLARGFTNAMVEDYTNSKQFKHDRYAHQQARRMVDGWRYTHEKKESTITEDPKEFSLDLLLFDEEYIANTESDYNKEDVLYMTKVLETMMKSEASTLEIYAQIVEFRDENSFSDTSIRSALNRVSIVRKLNQLEDPEAFYRSLSEKEKGMIQTAVDYERRMYPWMEEYLEAKKDIYDPYIKKDYTRFNGDGTGFWDKDGDGYDDSKDGYYSSSRGYSGRVYLPRTWDYWRKIKPRYRPNYTRQLYNRYQPKRKPTEMMEVGNRLFVAPMSETTNNSKARVVNRSVNFKAQQVNERGKDTLQTARRYAKQRGN